MDTSLKPRLRPDEPIQAISYEDLEKIERVVNAEAGTEGPEGRNAVRGVIFNRLASKRFGNTVESPSLRYPYRRRQFLDPVRRRELRSDHHVPDPQ